MSRLKKKFHLTIKFALQFTTTFTITSTMYTYLTIVHECCDTPNPVLGDLLMKYARMTTSLSMFPTRSNSPP